MSNKKRSGKKNLGLTRNQQRKRAYAAMRADNAHRARRAPKLDKVGVGVHQRPCGNPACQGKADSCYVLAYGRGVIPRSWAPQFVPAIKPLT